MDLRAWPSETARPQLRRVLHRGRALPVADEASLWQQIRDWLAARQRNASGTLEQDMQRAQACCGETDGVKVGQDWHSEDPEAECVGLQLRVAEKRLLVEASQVARHAVQCQPSTACVLRSTRR